MKITVVVPWLNHDEFAAAFAQAVAGVDEVIIVDTGSEPGIAAARDAVLRSSGLNVTVVSYEGKPTTYGGWCNFGLKLAEPGVVVFANNDISGQGQIWTSIVRQGAIQEGLIAGASLQARMAGGVLMNYLEGWFIMATTSTWEKISCGGFDHGGPWNTRDYEAPGYYEDNDLSLRATKDGIKIVQIPVPLQHLNNGTTRHIGCAFDASDRNRIVFDRAVQQWGGELLDGAA